MLDEIDYLLITALQHAPRADWSRIGAMLDVNATTAARRWARLTEAGLAWLGCHPSPAVIGELIVAFIEIDCEAGRLHEVCEQLKHAGHVLDPAGRRLRGAPFSGQWNDGEASTAERALLDRLSVPRQAPPP